MADEVFDTNYKSISPDENDTDSSLIPPHDAAQLQKNKSDLAGETTKIKQSNNSSKLDPCVFAPTGDIYSYFNRRPMLSSSAMTFQYPFRYSTVLALRNTVPVHGT